ncbi:MAG: alkaline phosphatase D family protein [Verrucomicrobiales bacterium]|nr:alkaline phosphatase D family protein [Verrucomicrobiales bacterium]
MKWSIFLVIALLGSGTAAEFSADWDDGDRVWTGESFWAGPMQDWRVSGGRLECFVSGGGRQVFVTTHEVGEAGEEAEMAVRLGRIGKAKGGGAGWGGFRVAIEGTLPDYRNAALHGRGTDVGVRTDGSVFFGKRVSAEKVDMSEGVDLRVKIGGGVAVVQAVGGGKVVEVEGGKGSYAGNVALVSHRQGRNTGRGAATARGGDVRFWFDDFSMRGDRVVAHGDRAWGPVLWSQYTLSKGVMKMNVQMVPLGEDDPDEVVLRYGEGKVARAKVDALARVAHFRIEGWDDAADVPYSVRLDGMGEAWEGTVRRDPVDKAEIVVAGFTGNTDYIFPDSTLVGNVVKHDPDVLFFSGDQLYESVGGYGIQRTWGAPVETVMLDYLRKWYLLGWAWRDLLKDRPSLFFPDDHDVYQGNIWGAGGIVSKKRGGFDDGGYGMAAEWVNGVQRTQTAHMPDPFDPAPVEQGIGVYYGDFNYGRVSFGMLEDRKFKSGPATMLPDKAGRADHVRREDVDEATWDPGEVDVDGAVLLGERQLGFLDQWAADWERADFKVVLSQTIFCNLANYHGGNKQYLIADLDSNGWPQTGRNKALRAMRKGFAFHYAGDQHLASIVQHGVDHWGDAGFSFCVPSISAGYPRSWIPDAEGRPVQNRPAPGLANTGEYKEGLGNHVTVYGIANPEEKNRTETPETLGHDKASGYGIVRLKRESREITMECWRLLVDVDDPLPGDQFPGWPRTIDLEDNYGRAAVGYLPTLEVEGIARPVVQVIEESSGETVYTLRAGGGRFRAKVFAPGSYTVVVSEPDEGKRKRLEGLKAGGLDESRVVKVGF